MTVAPGVVRFVNNYLGLTTVESEVIGRLFRRQAQVHPLRQLCYLGAIRDYYKRDLQPVVRCWLWITMMSDYVV